MPDRLGCLYLSETLDLMFTRGMKITVKSATRYSQNLGMLDHTNAAHIPHCNVNDSDVKSISMDYLAKFTASQL